MNPIDIQTILDIKRWQRIQDKFALVTNTAIITVDYKGVPVTKHSQCSEFCKKIRQQPKSNEICQKCDARGGIEAVRLNKNYIYRCHCNIIDAAIPIIIENKYFGCVMIGQVLLEENPENEYIEKIYKGPNALLSNQNEMLYFYSKLPRLTMHRIKEMVDLMDHIVKYIIKESIKNFELLEEQQMIKKKFERILHNEITQENSSLNNAEVKKNLYEIANKENSMLDTALQYIKENLHKKITLEDMANLCFITPGYFSKLFYREMGEKFSDYLIRLRIEKAKKLLKTTDKTIQQIGIEVGFYDAGYFIRRFKLYEGTTPGNYRRILKRQSDKYKIIP